MTFLQMFEVEHRGNTYKVGFSYKRSRKHHTPRTTVCRIAYKIPLKEQGNVIAEVNVHSPDQVIKKQGRKLALKKALEISLWDKETRTAIWEAYHDACMGWQWTPVEVTELSHHHGGLVVLRFPELSPWQALIQPADLMGAELEEALKKGYKERPYGEALPGKVLVNASAKELTQLEFKAWDFTQ